MTEYKEELEGFIRNYNVMKKLRAKGVQVDVDDSFEESIKKMDKLLKEAKNVS